MSRSLNHCDWYLLPIAERLKFKFLVIHVSIEKTLSFGGLVPLNMEFWLSVILVFIKIHEKFKLSFQFSSVCDFADSQKNLHVCDDFA